MCSPVSRNWVQRRRMDTVLFSATLYFELFTDHQYRSLHCRKSVLEAMLASSAYSISRTASRTFSSGVSTVELSFLMSGAPTGDAKAEEMIAPLAMERSEITSNKAAPKMLSSSGDETYFFLSPQRTWKRPSSPPSSSNMRARTPS